MLKTKKLNYIIAVAILGISFMAGSAGVSAFSGRGDLSPESKAVLEEIRSLRRSGDIEGAKKLAEENNIPERGRGWNKKEPQAVKTAIENKDYNAFVLAIKDSKLEDKVTEADFAKIVEAHNLRAAGDVIGAQKILKEIGIEMPVGGMGQGPRLENLTDEERVIAEKARELFQSGDRLGARELMKGIRVNANR